MLNTFTKKILGSTVVWAPSSPCGIAPHAIDLQASRHNWNGLLAE